MNKNWIKRLNELAEETKGEFDKVEWETKKDMLKAHSKIYTLIGFCQSITEDDIN